MAPQGAPQDVSVGAEPEDPQKLLTAAVCAFSPPKGTAKLPTAASLGKALSAVAHRNVGGRSFQSEWHTNLKQMSWRLIVVEPDAEGATTVGAGDAGVDAGSTRTASTEKEGTAGDAGDAGDNTAYAAEKTSASTSTQAGPVRSAIQARPDERSPASPASPALPEKQPDRVRVEKPSTPAPPARRHPQGFFLGKPVWVGPPTALPADVPVYELHGTPRGDSLAVLAIEVDGQLTRVAVDIGDQDRAIKWGHIWQWHGEWADGGIVGFDGTVRIVLNDGVVTTLSTIDPQEDLTPHEWRSIFRLEWVTQRSATAPSSST